MANTKYYSHYKLIDNFDDFLHLETEWEQCRLLQKQGEFCVSWYWLRHWYEVYWQPQNKLFIYAYYDQQRLVALLPCYLKKLALGYELRFLATGDPEAIEVCSEFQDFIIEDSFYHAVIEHFTQQLQIEKNIVALAFENILPTAMVFTWLNNLSLPKFKQRTTLTGMRFSINVEKTVTAQVQTFKSKTTRRHAKKYLALEACSIELLTNASLFDQFYQSLIIDHNNLWHNRGQQGAFAAEEFILFHDKFAKSLLAQHKLVLFKLIYKTQCIAIFYGIIDGDTLYYYQSAVGSHDDIPSVGVAMHIEALNIARKKGLSRYDLMKGQTKGYKNRYVIGQPAVYSVFLAKKIHYWLQIIMKFKQKIIG